MPTPEAHSEPINMVDFVHVYHFINQGTALLAKSIINTPDDKKIEARAIYTRTITAYSSSPEETDQTPFITASGNYVRMGTVAANWLPFGTAIRIPEIFGNQIFIVEDRMAKKHADKIDVWFPNKEDALKFGRQVAQIEVM